MVSYNVSKDDLERVKKVILAIGFRPRSFRFLLMGILTIFREGRPICIYPEEGLSLRIPYRRASNGMDWLGLKYFGKVDVEHGETWTSS